jgi:hypothetical protein
MTREIGPSEERRHSGESVRGQITQEYQEVDKKANPKCQEKI